VLTKKQYGTPRPWHSKRPRATQNDTWQEPTAVSSTRNSASDAELFPIIFKGFGLGKVLGMPTGGASSAPGIRVHGRLRMRSRQRWYTMKGENMEGLGAARNRVDQLPRQIIDDDDTQLKAAVQNCAELKQ
jgi:C-terminal processing protease CtpA/Prc